MPPPAPLEAPATKSSVPFRSQYDNQERTLAKIAAGHHRNIVGSLWDEMGDLQLHFLKAQGLRPEHRLLDIGCGCLRAGVKLIPYLEPDHYYGIDAEKALLDAGYKRELAKAGLTDRLSRDHLYASKLFIHRRLEDATIDMAICNSVMTHLPMNAIRLCLENTRPTMAPGARLFMTFFELPEDAPFAQPFTNAAGITTGPAADPYHYRASDMIHLARGTGWSANYIGAWDHPRGQMMMRYTAS